MTIEQIRSTSPDRTDNAATDPADKADHQRWRSVVLVGAVLFFCAASVVFVSRLAGFNLLREPQLKTRPTIVQFGLVPAGTIRHVDVEVENIGGRDLTIHDVKGSCDACIEVVERPNALSGRGAQGHIRFRISVGNSTGTNRRQAIIRSNDWAGRPHILPFEWTVVEDASNPAATAQFPETVSTTTHELIRRRTEP